MPEEHGGAQRRWIDDQRDPLMFLALMAATFSVWAGMHPPGGVYLSGPNALEPVILDRYPYFTASHIMALAFSMTLFVLLLSGEFFYLTPEKMTALVIIAVFDLVCLGYTFACY